ncbi:MAG: dehydrogenase, partial [Pirellulales bacterium]|nr:dehydrogenase [Pirellulales bacterium]
FVRVVDHEIGHWGHVNFDDFRFHAARPRFDNEITAEEVRRQMSMPPIDAVRAAGVSAEEAARIAELPPGFEMHVFAAEPDVRQPIAFCLDDRGRLWIAEGHAYPRKRPEGEGPDRILIFEDTDGDHRFDQRTVFAEGLNLVSGLEYGFGGVWVGAAPHLMFIPDRDRDDRPDGEPEILLDGWDFERDTHETLNTFCWGPDGWLYGCHGVFCPSHVGKPGTPPEERQRVDAAVWRYHPTRHEFEVFAEGTSNPWGIDFNEHGHCVIEACVIPHFWHVIQGARYQRQGGQHYSVTLEEMRRNRPYLPEEAPPHLNPFIFDDIKTHGDHVHWAGDKGPHAGNNRSDAAGGGHAHAGLMIYLGDSWPEEYRGAAFMNNIHGQRLNVDLLERRGSGYVGRHGPDFANFQDKWSQVLNMLYDHDGSVYLIDWYDRNQCHHNREDGHDRDNGRVFKIVYNDEPVTKVNLAERSDDELADLAVNASNEWRSRHARRLLQERAAEGEMSGRARESLASVLRRDTGTVASLRAMWT